MIERRSSYRIIIKRFQVRLLFRNVLYFYLIALSSSGPSLSRPCGSGACP